MLRQVVAIDYRLGDAPKTGRLRIAAFLGADADTLFSGEGYAPAPFSDDERAVLAQSQDALPAWADVNLPAWLQPHFERRFGADWAEEARALNTEAPVDLRVNRLKTSRDQAMAALAAEGVEARPMPYAPDGLRIEGRFVLGAIKAHTDGWIEPQDEASQLVAHWVGAEPDMTVIDLCAGAGGKTLALAAAMRNRGRLIACDIEASRLDRLGPRARRAGAENFDSIVVDAAETAPDSLLGVADRVLVDAPCSGIGTWRRQPDARLRLAAEEVAELTALQSRLLGNACRMLKPGGLLVYAVCSVLREEGPDPVAAFVEANPDVLPAALASATDLPPVCFAAEVGVTLTPRTTVTDGFYAAGLRRQA